jgi:hypothetical protein
MPPPKNSGAPHSSVAICDSAWCHMRERERIGAGSGRHQENGDLALENLREAALDPPGPGIVAVGQRRPFIRARDRGENFRRNRRSIVAGEIHRHTLRLKHVSIILRPSVAPRSAGSLYPLGRGVRVRGRASR